MHTFAIRQVLSGLVSRRKATVQAALLRFRRHGAETPAPRLDALLFGETQSRIVVSATSHNSAKVLGQAKVLGIPALQIGKVGGEQLKIKAAQGEFGWPLKELHDLWFHSIARAMK